MAAHLASVRRALAQQDAEVDRYRAIIEENSALNERILEHEDTIARQAAELSTLRSEADDTMTARAAQTAARRLELAQPGLATSREVDLVRAGRGLGAAAELRLHLAAQACVRRLVPCLACVRWLHLSPGAGVTPKNENRFNLKRFEAKLR